MRRRIRKILALLAAVAVAGGGFGRAALAAVPEQPCHPGIHQPATHVHDGHAAPHAHDGHAGHVMHHDHQDDNAHHHGVPDESSADQACFKCCGLCAVVGTPILPRAPGEIVFAAALIFYVMDTLSYTDRPVILDPGIPKRTA